MEYYHGIWKSVPKSASILILSQSKTLVTFELQITTSNRDTSTTSKRTYFVRKEITLHKPIIEWGIHLKILYKGKSNILIFERH